MWGEPAAAEGSVTLHQPEVHHVFSQGSCPWITGPWQWRAAQAPGRGGVESDLCLHTGRSEERRVGKECRSRWSPYH